MANPTPKNVRRLSCKLGYKVRRTEQDPFCYMTGFGNRFDSEVLPNSTPDGQNTSPQTHKYSLFTEQLNGWSVVSKRQDIRHVWMYRIRPAVAHKGFANDKEVNQHVESNFNTSNPNTSSCISQQAWDPFPLLDKQPEGSSEPGVDFIDGMRTVGGSGNPVDRTGVAIHIYSCNTSMKNTAFCNNDGDMLILPQHGRLDIQTELGWLRVKAGELLVVPSGIRFRVLLVDGPSRGYIQEVFGTHYELPELGPLGSNGMAAPRDFWTPVASFDIDETEWRITHKHAGRLQHYRQPQTPFDVVGWHGNLVPYKYDMRKFTNVANANKDQADPTVYCVLTAKSQFADIPVTDFLIFTEKWLTAENSLRPPYYHRNMSTEMMGLLYGTYGGSSHALEPGGLSYEASYMPHGETFEVWKDAMTRELKPEKVCQGTMAFMFQIGYQVLLTKWALEGEGSKSLHPTPEDLWENVRPPFLDQLELVEEDLKAAGMPPLTELYVEE